MSGNISMFQDCLSSSVRCLLTEGTGNSPACQSFLAQLALSALSRNVGRQCVQHSQLAPQVVLGWEAGLAEGIILKKIVQRNNSGSSNWLCHEVCCSSTGRWEWQEPALGEPSSALTSQGKSCWCLYLQGVSKAIPCVQSTSCCLVLIVTEILG